jgi:hypothetical protein
MRVSTVIVNVFFRLQLVTDDDSFEREYHAVRNSLNDLKTQHSPALSHVPASFIANPKINFAGFREMAHKLQSRTSLANFWLEEINRAEATHEKETNVSFDKEAEDALLNVLVPLERQFADVVSVHRGVFEKFALMRALL